MSKPFTLDLKKLYESKISNIEASLDSMKRNFGLDKIPYYYEHKNLANGISQSDMFYKDLEVGHIIIWKKFIGLSPKYVRVEITHKFGGVVFFKELKTKANYYIDFVSHLHGLYGDTFKEKYEDKYTAPMHVLFPAEVLCPDYIDVTEAHFPSLTKIKKI